jgi:hypothetical protein
LLSKFSKARFNLPFAIFNLLLFLNRGLSE